MLAIIDYDAGNLRSVAKALEKLGETPVITRNPAEILSADHIILPGVGSFGDAMNRLHQYGLVDVIRKASASHIPFLGICSGKILRIPDTEGLKIPHMGWNSLSYHREPGENPHGRLFAGIPEDSYVYFVHSYYLKADDPVIVTATTEYGTHIHASIEQGNVFGCQFHPEKSSSTGLAILKNFLSIRKEEF